MNQMTYPKSKEINPISDKCTTIVAILKREFGYQDRQDIYSSKGLTMHAIRFYNKQKPYSNNLANSNFFYQKKKLKKQNFINNLTKHLIKQYPDLDEDKIGGIASIASGYENKEVRTELVNCLVKYSRSSKYSDQSSLKNVEKIFKEWNPTYKASIRNCSDLSNNLK